MKEEREEKRKICEGCRTGNYYLCNSFPGQAQEHAQREIDYRRSKTRKLERIGKGPQVYRREDEVEVPEEMV